MITNLFSLLSSNWMFAENGNSILMPYLLSLINGNLNNIEGTLEKTTFQFKSKSGFETETNSSSVQPDSVAVLKIHHPIFKYDQTCGPKGTQSIMAILEEWKINDNIKGVVLDFNSGGGQVSGTPEISEYINNFSKSKPIVSFTKNTVGSAAYYMASGSSYFIAHKHADWIGSVGVMYKSINMEGVLIQKGATINEIYSELSPEKNKTTRALKNGDSEPLIKEILNPFASEFHADTKKYRPNISEKALKGDVFRPKQALAEGLIDEIGTMQTAIDKVFELAAKKELKKPVKMKYPKIQEASGVKIESDTKDGIFLNTLLAESVESKLISLEKSAKEYKGNAESSSAQLIDLNKTQNELIKEVNTSLNLEDGAKVTDFKSAIKALNEKIEELNAGPGDEHTKVKKKNTSSTEHSYMDLDTPFYNSIKNHLN